MLSTRICRIILRLCATPKQGTVLTSLYRFDEGFACIKQVEETAMHDKNMHVLGGPYLAKGTALFRICRYEDAVSCFKKALKLNPDDNMAHFLMGDTLLELHKLKDAIPHHDRAIHLQFELPDVYYKKACALNGCKRCRAALRYLRGVLRKSPDHADAHLEMGISYMRLEKFRHAIRCYKRAIQADPDHARAHLYLGATYMLLEQYSLAKPHLERAVSPDPVDPYILEILALLHDKIYNV